MTTDQACAFLMWSIGCMVSTVIYVEYPDLFGNRAREKFVLVFLIAAVSGALMQAPPGGRMAALLVSIVGAAIALGCFFILPTLVGLPADRVTRLHLLCFLPGALVAIKMFTVLTEPDDRDE
jgi:Flp pilus assembly protein protease CpaA